MNNLTIGIFIIVISVLGYFSNWLNWRSLNYKLNYLLYYMGAFIHESSHAILCLLTGAKINKFQVFVRQPSVSYTEPKFPLIGNLLISIAPIFGGLSFIFLMNKFFLQSYFVMPNFSSWYLFIEDFLFFLKQINIFEWKSWVIILFSINIGATLAPSKQDLRNVWFFILILCLIPWKFFEYIGLEAICFILIGLISQTFLILLISLFKKIKQLVF